MSKEDQILFEYAINKNIGEYIECKKTSTKYFEFSIKDMTTLINDELIIDGSEGGLVDISLKDVNCVFVLLPVENNRYRYIGFQMSGVYITGYLSYIKFKNEFEKLESDIDNFINLNPAAFTVPEACKIIEVKKPLSFILLSDYSQFICTKPTVLNHINRIVEIEKQFYN